MKRFNLKCGFSLSEMMVVMLILTIVIAAAAPIVTRRNNAPSTTAISNTPAGVISAYGGSTMPDGWLLCNGQAVSRTSYANLYSAIGTTYGNGDGSTTFNVPDLRGEFIRGADNGRGVDSGRALGSSQTDELKSHSHQIPVLGIAGGTMNAVGSDPSSVTTGAYVSYSTGGTETRPRNIAINYIIKH